MQYIQVPRTVKEPSTTSTTHCLVPTIPTRAFSHGVFHGNPADGFRAGGSEAACKQEDEVQRRHLCWEEDDAIPGYVLSRARRALVCGSGG